MNEVGNLRVLSRFWGTCYLPTGHPQFTMTNTSQTVGQQSDDRWRKLIVSKLGRLSADWRPTVGRLSVLRSCSSALPPGPGKSEHSAIESLKDGTYWLLYFKYGVIFSLPYRSFWYPMVCSMVYFSIRVSIRTSNHIRRRESLHWVKCNQYGGGKNPKLLWPKTKSTMIKHQDN